MGDYAVVDESQAPIIHVRVVGEPDELNFEQYIREVDAAFRRHERFGLVFNTGELSQLQPRFRGRLSSWMTETERDFQGHLVCAAFVIKSKILRGVLMAVFWVSKPYYRVKLFSKETAAWDWTRRQLKEQGVLDVAEA